MPTSFIRTLPARLRDWFPEREFIMRAEGRVRFIRISSRLQMGVAGAVFAALLVWLIAMTVALGIQVAAVRARADMLERQAAVARAESRVARYKGDISGVAADLGRREDFIEKVVKSHIGELPANLPQGTVSDSAGESGKTVRKVSLTMPEASGLARIEARQLSFVETLTRYADARSAAAEAHIRKLGLNPARILASADRKDAQGGPFEALFTGADHSVDPRFARLGASLERMSALENGLAAIPSTLPASLQFISSGFGYRTDPINGGAAFHPGLDFRGPIGAPIYAAARGRVIWAGERSGYGNCVEVDHGNGLVTRYAHMSRILAHLGQPVRPGEEIGLIGSTGRSTGPHLHFEVRINDQPVNPRPFLEAQTHVSQEVRNAPGVRS